MKFKLFQVHKDKVDQWKQWCTFLVQNEAEVLNTLKEEENTHEVNHLLTLNGESYVLYGMEGKFKKGSDCELNVKHRKMVKECLTFVCELEQLFDFKV